jgi:hypothetical protein
MLLVGAGVAGCEERGRSADHAHTSESRIWGTRGCGCPNFYVETRTRETRGIGLGRRC